ncbi:hypothetical protein DDB_G0290645 [Dictyostelium discoideum AX4]|uniref:Uncharacterized protein n=1 Tax=Dictyostelium discoideum TaxID=44689 RepID=Q54FV4_DICDI|nr:hypothetical protein DDB_G0290645 [Dictyostelium discoideum AX4]EAL62183.1 hypothetical protein DDB_G0290645 [Dictyostelium discoideum AX4]|eukprot:XP_635663.1 hypothetical protein DDB_G0290645 [Dictyostelium discoideum AX4]
MKFIKILLFVLVVSYFNYNNDKVLSFILNSSSSSPPQDFILSISTFGPVGEENLKQILLINPWTNSTNKLISNSTINIQYDILDILFVDFTQNTVVLLCENEINEYLLISLENINSETPTISSISSIKSNIDENEFSYTLQKYIFNYKIGYLPIELKSNQTFYIMELNFPNGEVNFIDLETPNIDIEINQQQLIQGFDYTNKIMYISYKTNNNEFNLISYNPINATNTQRVYQTITNIETEVNMIFTDSLNRGDIYMITPDSVSLNLTICKLNFKTSTCDQILITSLNIEIVNSEYHFLPYFLNQDKSSLILLSIVDNGNLNIEIFDINNNFTSINIIIQSGQWSNSKDLIWSKFAF